MPYMSLVVFIYYGLPRSFAPRLKPLEVVPSTAPIKKRLQTWHTLLYAANTHNDHGSEPTIAPVLAQAPMHLLSRLLVRIYQRFQIPSNYPADVAYRTVALVVGMGVCVRTRLQPNSVRLVVQHLL